MICVKEVKRYCRVYWRIENYNQAMADESQVWHCHHRKETDNNLTMKELIAMGCYYDVHYSELIFLTPEEHTRLHHKGKAPNKTSFKKGQVPWNKGKHHTEETKQKLTKFNIHVEELYDLYVVQGLSTLKIAAIYGCDPTTIWGKLKKYNIYKHDRSRKTRKKEKV